ncbi:DUF1311 domain-containing protein [Ensifer sp. MPMI2T]|nr:DUF1311 domain-containing protein [Ensifer sp. MPMI2T]
MKALTPQAIIEWKKRRGAPRNAVELVAQINELRSIWVERSHTDRFLGDFILVRLVTIIEVFIRSSVAEMVDSDVPEFCERARALVKDRKLDFIFVDSIGKQELSVGDIVSHAISVSSLDSLLTVLETLIPDLGKELPLSHARWTEDAASFPLKPIIEDYGQTKERIKRLFESRHVVVHEMSAEPAYADDELIGFCEAAASFVEAADWVTVKLIEGTVPRTQDQMTANALDVLKAAEEELEQTFSKAASIAAIDGDLLERSQAAWRAFAECDAELHASRVEGGTMHSMLFASRMEQLTADRIDDLVDLIEQRDR